MRGKYKAGEYVRIKDDLEVGKLYGSMSCSEGMKKLCGHIARIDYDLGSGMYRLNISGYYWIWTDEMLEPVQFSSDGKKDLQGRKEMPSSAEKLCKLIGALLYAGVEEFNISYSRGEISCSAEMNVSEVEDR